MSVLSDFGIMITIITAIFIFLIDFIIYKTTPYSIRKEWPWWKYLVGGAIIARYKFNKPR